VEEFVTRDELRELVTIQMDEEELPAKRRKVMEC